MFNLGLLIIRFYNHLEIKGLLEVTGLILSAIGACMTVSRLILSDKKVNAITIPFRRTFLPESSHFKIGEDITRATGRFSPVYLTPDELEKFNKELNDFARKLIKGLERERNKAKKGLLLIIMGIALQIIAKVM